MLIESFYETAIGHTRHEVHVMSSKNKVSATTLYTRFGDGKVVGKDVVEGSTIENLAGKLSTRFYVEAAAAATLFVTAFNFLGHSKRAYSDEIDVMFVAGAALFRCGLWLANKAYAHHDAVKEVEQGT